MSETSLQPRSVRIPARQVPAVMEALVTTYAQKADALAATAGAYHDARAPLAAIHAARRDLAAAEDALEAFSGPAEPATADLELSGAAYLVREVLHAALLVAAESFAERCLEYEAAHMDRAALAASIGDLVVLHDLFAALEAADAL